MLMVCNFRSVNSDMLVCLEPYKYFMIAPCNVLFDTRLSLGPFHHGFSYFNNKLSPLLPEDEVLSAQQKFMLFPLPVLSSEKESRHSS